MDWITLSIDDLEIVLNKPQLDTLKSINLSSIERDPCVDILESITARIRLEISASGLNSLDQNHSKIPFELKDCALRLAVESLQARIPALEITNSQQKRADEARALLLRVASGELPISRPLSPIETAKAKKGIHASAHFRVATRRSMGGLS